MAKITILVENIFMTKAIIVGDDDRLADLITRTVETYLPNISLVSRPCDIKTAIACINEYEPDLVLVDIRLKDGSGFELIDHFGKADFKVIFMSSHADYAIKAIKYQAIDYLLKPIKEEELAQAIKKADDQIRFEEKLHAKALGESIKKLGNDQRLVLKSSDQVHLVNIKDIIRIKADGNYSTFYLPGDKKIMISKSTKEFEELLIDQGFHRIHKSHIININKMSYFDKADGGTLIMSNGDQVPVASRKRELLMTLFESLT